MNAREFRIKMNALGFTIEQTDLLIINAGRHFDNIGLSAGEAQERFRQDLLVACGFAAVGVKFEQLTGEKE